MTDFGFEKATTESIAPIEAPKGWGYVKDNAGNDVYFRTEDIIAVVRRDADGQCVLMYKGGGGYTAVNKPITTVLPIIFGEGNETN